MAGRGPRQGGPRSAMLDHMLHMAGMVDDDAMMELAIQLSLQEQVRSLVVHYHVGCLSSYRDTEPVIFLTCRYVCYRKVVVVKHLHKFHNRFKQVAREKQESTNNLLLKSLVKVHTEIRRGSHKLNHER